MMRMLKQLCGLAMIGLGLQHAAAFSLLGPYEAWQTEILSYQLPGDVGGPQNLGEEYRQNIPKLLYTFDQNFLDYFGSNGVVAVDAAMSVYNSLSNVSSYSSDLSEWTLESKRSNSDAEPLGLLDVKSVLMAYLAEQAGLAQPVRFTWTLRDRLVGPGGCPADVQYLVIMRNFDPAMTGPNQLQPSKFVNGSQFSYFISEICTPPPVNLANATEYPVDPLSLGSTAVANRLQGISAGQYFTGLTRDDVGGLRYLWSSNNMNIENAGADTVQFVTNTAAPQLLYSSNLTAFVAAARTNDAAALQALYPTLVISSSTPYFVNVVTTNVFLYSTNYPWDPYGAAPHTASNYTYSVSPQTWYNHTFANVVTNQYFTIGNVQMVVTNNSFSACPPTGVFTGQPCVTNYSVNMPTNLLRGGFYIIPPNLCGIQILSTQLINRVYVTNSTVTITDTGTTNAAGQFISLTMVYYWDQYIYAINPVTCPQNTTSLRQGVENIKYERHDFDSLLSQFFVPVTNLYTVYAVSNNAVVAQRMQRVVTRPDFLVSAADLGVQPPPAFGPFIIRRTFNPVNTGGLTGLNGPGLLPTPNTFTFNKVGPIYENQSPSSLDEASQTPDFIWGSFDGSTNAPIVYPNGTDIVNLENQVLIQVGPAGAALPNGKLGVNYTNAFSGLTVTGGSAPYNWSMAPNSPALPWGLTLNQFTGKISGVPLSQGTYDFTIRLTDAGARYVDRPYSMTINP